MAKPFIVVSCAVGIALAGGGAAFGVHERSLNKTSHAPPESAKRLREGGVSTDTAAFCPIPPRGSAARDRVALNGDSLLLGGQSAVPDSQRAGQCEGIRPETGDFSKIR